MGFQDITVWSGRPELVTTYFTDINVCMCDNVADLQNISKFRRLMLFVSGSCTFVRNMVTLFKGFKIWATVLAKGAGGQWKCISRIKGLNWGRFRHSQVGGVTDGAFWVGSNTSAKLEGELDPNFRCLKDILSPMVGGQEI
jgi:hypothetical protein